MLFFYAHYTSPFTQHPSQPFTLSPLHCVLHMFLRLSALQTDMSAAVHFSFTHVSSRACCSLKTSFSGPSRPHLSLPLGSCLCTSPCLMAILCTQHACAHRLGYRRLRRRPSRCRFRRRRRRPRRCCSCPPAPTHPIRKPWPTPCSGRLHGVCGLMLISDAI